MVVLKVRLNMEGRKKYEEYKNSSFYIPFVRYSAIGGTPIAIGKPISKRYLKVCEKFHIPDDIELKIKDFKTLCTQYPYEESGWVNCQYDFSRTMDEYIAGDYVKISDLVENHWEYRGYYISLDMLELKRFTNEIKRID